MYLYKNLKHDAVSWTSETGLVYMLLSQNDNFADTSFLQKGAVWPVGYECARGEKKANLRRFLGNLKVHLKTKSAHMH